jgi:hypothetical protein
VHPWTPTPSFEGHRQPSTQLTQLQQPQHLLLGRSTQLVRIRCYILFSFLALPLISFLAFCTNDFDDLYQIADKDGVRNVRTVGGPSQIWQIPNGEKVVINFNNSFQPTGPGSEKFRRIVGKLVRSENFVDIRTKSWKKVPLQKKEELWSSLMVWNTHTHTHTHTHTYRKFNFLFLICDSLLCIEKVLSRAW